MHCNCHAPAFGCILPGISNQVAQHLSDTRGIPSHLRQLFGLPPLQGQVLLTILLVERGDDLPDDFTQSQRLDIQPHSPRFDARNIQDVIDQSRQPISVRLDNPQKVSLSIREATGHTQEEEIGISLDRGHGRAEFMGNRGNEFIL